MIRFIDLTGQICDGEKEFAFFDTVTGRFIDVNGEQTWDTVEDLKSVYTGKDIDRYLNLIPEHFK
jgi:hypothetical protein